MLLRDTIVGALVVQSTGRRDYSVQDIELIGVICAQLVGIIENARIIEALDRGDQPKPRTAPRPSSTDQAGDEEDHPIRRTDDRIQRFDNHYYVGHSQDVPRGIAGAAIVA
jgi:GAF domain-containing protein